MLEILLTIFKVMQPLISRNEEFLNCVLTKIQQSHLKTIISGKGISNSDYYVLNGRVSKVNQREIARAFNRLTWKSLIPSMKRVNS